MDQNVLLIKEIALLITSESLTGVAIRSCIALSCGLVAWLILKAIMHSLEKRLKKFDFFESNGHIFTSMRKALGYVLILIMGTYLLKLWGLPLFEKLFQAVLLMLFAKPIKDFLLIALNYFEQKWVNKTETKVDNIIFDLLNRFSGAVIYAVAAVLALDILGINVMPFIAGAGILGVAIGFAAKDTLSNLIAGVLLIIDRPFEINDRIEVWSAPAGSATWGDVLDIGLRATKIKTTDNIIIVIPNNEIMKRDIVNYTISSSAIRVRINIGVSYDTDIEKAKKAILEVAHQVDWIRHNPPPKVVVRNFGASSVDLQLRVWIEDARRRMDTISFITDQVKLAFDAHGIEIPYPKRDIYLYQQAKAGHDEPVKSQKTDGFVNPNVA